ncbi:hypothetical protein OROMI_007583 [Orobanche minor]
MEENGMAKREIMEDFGEGDTSYYDEKTTRSRLAKWIWNTVLSLGKKAVMTGVVISFVPLVLPPLILVAALCCALSLPFGVVFASYGCTNKLMSKLMPSPPLVVQEYNQTVVLPEEEEEREVVKDEVEMRIELVGDTKSSDAVTDDELSTVGGGHVSLLDEKKIRNDHDGGDDDSQNIKDGASEVQIDKATDNIECLEKVADREEEEDQSSQDKIKKAATVAATEDKDMKDSKKETSSSKEIEKLPGKRKNTSKRHGKLGGEEKGIVVVPREITDTEVVQETNDKERCLELNVGNADKLSADLKKMLDIVRVEDVGDSTGVLAGNEGGIDKVEHHAVTIYNDPGIKQRTRNYDAESKVLAGDGKLKHDEKIRDVKEEKVAGAVNVGEHSDENIFQERVVSCRRAEYERCKEESEERINQFIPSPKYERESKRKIIYFLRCGEDRQTRLCEEEEARKLEEMERRKKEEAERKAKLGEIAAKQRQRKRELEEKERQWRDEILGRSSAVAPSKTTTQAIALAPTSAVKYVPRFKRVAAEGSGVQARARILPREAIAPAPTSAGKYVPRFKRVAAEGSGVQVRARILPREALAPAPASAGEYMPRFKRASADVSGVQARARTLPRETDKWSGGSSSSRMERHLSMVTGGVTDTDRPMVAQDPLVIPLRNGKWGVKF